jgi:soluble lytic murein transglycosylase-like protein
MWLLPVLSQSTAERYTDLILQNAERNKLDPFLVSAIIRVESHGRWWAMSGKGDYGLMQCRVSKTTNPEYIGREQESRA